MGRDGKSEEEKREKFIVIAQVHQPNCQNHPAIREYQIFLSVTKDGTLYKRIPSLLALAAASVVMNLRR